MLTFKKVVENFTVFSAKNSLKAFCPLDVTFADVGVGVPDDPFGVTFAAKSDMRSIKGFKGNTLNLLSLHFL